MEEESPYVTTYNNEKLNNANKESEIEGGKIALKEDYTLKYIVYGILIFVVIMVLYSAYCSFCENRDSGFLSSGVRDDIGADDDYVEKQIKILKRLQKNNLGDI